MSVQLLFRIDLGFDEARGYAAVVFDVTQQRQKGIRGNSAEQLASRLRHVLIDELNKRRNFPLESEPSRIITPNGME
jgi:hypothetical protein